MSFPRFLGVILTSLGGLVAIGICLAITKNANSLWALLAVAIMVSVLSRSQRTSSMVALAAGVSMFLLSLAVSAAVFLTGNPNCLWGLLGVAVAGHAITGTK